ncbi:MAG: TIR domain-containing protein, partial [Anaerolineales bacterium]
MKPNIFLSYSRREVGFVDQLTNRLEQEGFQVWLDYRSLVPGSPWKTQIEKGLDESEVILLVVSKESMASTYVELEWRRVIKEDKRVVLAIFEAVDLPEVLEKYEWVDFRGNFEAGIKELVEQLESPVQEEHPVPETGFKVSGVVWWAFFLSMATAFMSLFCLWSLFIPFFLLPLPYRIFKRDFNLSQVQAALWMLPVALVLTSFAADPALADDYDPALSVFFFAVVIAPVLIVVLRSKGMQRWGKPQASLVEFAGLYKPEDLQPESVSFFIDHAPQDRHIADEMTRTFTEHGHSQATDIQSAKAVFALLSEFKTDTEADPESQTVFPVMIQTCNPADKLSKVQWIDFRRGVRNLDAMAKLLPEPAKLLKALGVRPVGNQLTLPPIIMGMNYFLTLLGIFILGSVFKSVWEFPENLIITAAPVLIFLVLIGVLLYFLIRALVNRKGRLAGFVNFSLALVVFGILSFLQSFVPLSMLPDDNFSLADAYPVMAYAVGMTVMLIFLVFRYRDVRRW